MKTGILLGLCCVLMSVHAAETETYDFTAAPPAGAERNEEGVWIFRDGMDLGDAFKLEVEFEAGESRVKSGQMSVAFDQMGGDSGVSAPNAGLKLAFVRTGDVWGSRIFLGFGDHTCYRFGPEFKLQNGEQARVAVVWDGNHNLVWALNGKVLLKTYLEEGLAVVRSRRATAVGGRIYGPFLPFCGTIRAVRISRFARKTVELAGYAGRTVFERGETTELKAFVENLALGDLRDARIEARQFSADEQEVIRKSVKLGAVAEGAKIEYSLPVETRLRPGKSILELTLLATGTKGAVKETQRTQIDIAPTFAPRMPSLIWYVESPIETVAEYGFTHILEKYLLDSNPKPDAFPRGTLKELDKALRCGVRLGGSFHFRYPNGARTPEEKKPYQRRMRDGTGEPELEVSHPEVLADVRRVSAINAKAVKDHPAFAAAHASVEGRDAIYPSFNTEAAQYEKASGQQVPPEVTKKTLKFDEAKRRFPDGIVPSGDPVFKYLRWLWKGGDGWPRYAKEMANEYRRQIRREDYFSFADPAVRCPPLWGSCGSVDVLNHWNYANPEPMNIAAATEEMFAMAAGRKGQRVMAMTQLICYRNQLAPDYNKVPDPPQWMKDFPNTKFPAIPPDVLEEATWSMLAKPVMGVAFHGWGCIKEGVNNGYDYTNPETEARIRKLLKGPIAELGPFLKDLGREEPDFAVLESATTCLMGGPASWGWRAPAITFMQRARLDPKVVYEETLYRDGTDGLRVIYAPQLAMTTPGVVKILQEFQKRGGILIGDDQMVKSLEPDLLVSQISFFAPPASDHTADVEAMDIEHTTNAGSKIAAMRAKQGMAVKGEKLKQELKTKGYRPPADSSSHEIVIYNRNWNGTPYLVAINDHRTFGDYTGQWGTCMEKALPFEGSVSLVDAHRKVRAVYELVKGGEVKFSRNPVGDVVVPVRYETTDGRVFAFLDAAIAKVRLTANERVTRGEPLEIRFEVLAADGQPVRAILPVEIRVYDAKGQELDGVGFVAAKDGVCVLQVPTNLDDPSGGYRIVAKDRASGMSSEFRVR